MNRLNFPLLRSEIVLEPRYLPGLGQDNLRYVAFDPASGAELWVTDAEGHIMRAAQQLRGELNVDAIIGFVKLHFDTQLNEAQIATCLERLGELQWLATDKPRAELREAYWQTRQKEQSARKLERLKGSIRRMREEVPYYRTLFAEQGLSEADLHRLEDLGKFPRLGKAQLREQFEKLHPDSLKEQKAWWGELVWRSSSGSTGPRTQTVAGADNYAYTLYETLGPIAPRQPSRQCLFIPPACTGATCHMETAIPYERRILFGNTLLMNAFRNACTVTDAVLEEFAQEIERFKPLGLMGAGSYIYPLARYIKRTGRKVPKIEFIHLHVEVCSRIHRRLLEEVFECPVLGCYVSIEMGFAAVQCPHGNYHVGRGFELEILAKGQPAQPGQMGRLAATTLTTFNRLTPLLRFELGDLAIPASSPCNCAPLGNLDVIASIEGRLAEVIVTKDRKLITPRAVDNAITDGPQCRNIAFYDLVQEKNGRYLLELVADDKQAGFDESGLLAALKGLLGADAEIDIQQREEIMPTLPAGRYRLCYSKMEQDLSTLI
jgi:phenylacetate-CoA ligase